MLYKFFLSLAFFITFPLSVFAYDYSEYANELSTVTLTNDNITWQTKRDFDCTGGIFTCTGTIDYGGYSVVDSNSGFSPELKRSAFAFDFSSVPSGSVLTSGRVCIQKEDGYPADDPYNYVTLQAVYASIGTEIFDQSNFGTLISDSGFAVTSGGGEVCAELNSAGLLYIQGNIGEGGMGFGLRASTDYEDVDNDTRVALVYFADGNGSNSPRLEFDYSAGGSSSSSGSGSGLSGTGSLVGWRSACDHYVSIDSGSGETMDVCDEWSYSIEIPMMAFFVDSVQSAGVYSVLLLLILCIFYKLIFAVLRFFFRLFTFKT